MDRPHLINVDLRFFMGSIVRAPRSWCAAVMQSACPVGRGRTELVPAVRVRPGNSLMLGSIYVHSPSDS